MDIMLAEKYLVIFFFLLGHTLFASSADDLLQAERLYQEGLFHDSISLYEKILEKDNTPLLRLAQAYLHHGDSHRIIEIPSGSSAEENILKSLAMIQLGDFPSCLSLLADHAHPFVPLIQGIAYLGLENTEKADEIFQRIVSEQSPSDEATIAQGYRIYLAIKTGQLAQAQECMDALSDIPSYWEEEWRHLRAQLLEAYQKQGILFFEQAEWEEAERAFLHVAEENPAEGLYWAARAAEAREASPDTIRSYRQTIFTAYPESPFAAEAYLTYYSLADYFSGKKAPLRHLQQLPHQFPHSPEIMTTYYYLGLQKSTVSDWNQAIAHFHEVEKTYERGLATDTLEKEALSYYSSLYQTAKKERALANLTIAQEAEGTKRKIYAEYAQNILESLRNEILSSEISEEITYFLARTHQLQEHVTLAVQEWDALLTSSPKGKYAHYAWQEKGHLAFAEGNATEALAAFQKVELVGKEWMTNDERLLIWIAQSHCYRRLQQNDTAMQILSQVINDPSISPLRVEAMDLRAQIYDEQGRHELAHKQRRAIEEKGGSY